MNPQDQAKKIVYKLSTMAKIDMRRAGKPSEIEWKRLAFEPCGIRII
jgi:hypothetical protein